MPFGERQSGPATPWRAPHPLGVAPRQQGDRHDRSGRSAPVPARQGVLARQQRRQARLSAAGARVVPGCIMRMDQGWRMCRASCRNSLRITRNQRCARMGEGMIVIMGHNALRGGGMGDKHRNRQDRDRTRQHLPDGRSPRADRCRLHGPCNADGRDLFQITARPFPRRNGACTTCPALFLACLSRVFLAWDHRHLHGSQVAGWRQPPPRPAGKMPRCRQKARLHAASRRSGHCLSRTPDPRADHAVPWPG